MIKEKEFHSACQQEVYTQVRRFLDELVDEHYDDAEHCDFYLKFGSTLLEISVHAFEEDNAVVEILAYCVQGVQPSLELCQTLLSLNAEIPLGAFSMVDHEVYYSHSFLGRNLQAEQFIASLSSVAAIADEYDEVIVSRFGGETALERLRSMSRRRMHPEPSN